MEQINIKRGSTISIREKMQISDSLQSQPLLLEKRRSANEEENKTKSISSEAIQSISAYFRFFYEDNNLVKRPTSKVIEQFMGIFKQFQKEKNANDILFLAFWYPYIQSLEQAAIEILQVTQIFYGEEEILDLANNAYPASVLNTYAFNIISNNIFPEDILCIVLDQGKISIPIEWIMEKLLNKKFEIVEHAFNSDNDCFVRNPFLVKVFVDALAKHNSLENISLEDKSSPYGSKNISFRSLQSHGKNRTAVRSEFKDFNTKGKGKLTITKLIIAASLLKVFYSLIPSFHKIPMNEATIPDIIRVICLFDKDKKYSSQILQALYTTDNREIAFELLSSNLLSIDLKVFKLSLSFKDMKFALQFYNLYSDFKIYTNETFYCDVIGYISSDIQNIEVYLFFINQFIPSFTIHCTKFLLKIFEELLSLNREDNKILQNISNPIKIFVLFAESLTLMKKRHPLLEYNINRLIMKCFEYSQEMQNLVEEDNVFRELILEKDILGRSVLDIISKNDFLDLLRNKLIDKIVDDLWNGPYSLQGSFLTASSQFRSMFFSISSKDYDIFTKERRGLSDYRQEAYKSNFTHFQVWRCNVYIKYYLELFVTVFFLGIIQILSLYMLSRYQDIQATDPQVIANFSMKISSFINDEKIIYDDLLHNCNTTQINLHQDMNEILLQSKDIYSTFIWKISFITKSLWFILILCYFFFILPLPYISRVIFHLKTKSPGYGYTIISDLALFIVVILLKLMWNWDNITVLEGIISRLTIDQINCFQYLQYFASDFSFCMGGKDPLMNEFLLLSIICLLLWVRLFFQLRISRELGPIIVIFILSLKGIFTYLLLFMMVIFAYACFAILNFYRLTGYQYQNILFSFFYNVLLSLGGDPNFDSYNDQAVINDKPYVPWVGLFATLIILLFNSVVLFNIVIALLSNIYEKYHNSSQQLFIQNKLEERNNVYSDDVRYDSLLSTIFPFDVITFPLIFGFLFIKSDQKAKKLNMIILSVHYAIYATICFVIYFCLTFILIPITFIKVIITKGVQIFVNDIQQYFAVYKVCCLFCYCSFGIFLQMNIFVIDLIIFIKELFKDQFVILTANENDGKYYIAQHCIKIILDVTKTIDQNDDVYIPIEHFLHFLRQYLEVTATKNGIFPHKMKSKDAIDDIRQQIKEYNKTEHKNANKFQSYLNPLAEEFHKKGIHFEMLVDYLINFCDDRNLLNVKFMKNVIKINKKNIKLRRFFEVISDKNFSLNQMKNQIMLLSNIQRIKGIIPSTKIAAEEFESKISNVTVHTKNRLLEQNNGNMLETEIKTGENQTSISGLNRKFASNLNLSNNKSSLIQRKLRTNNNASLFIGILFQNKVNYMSQDNLQEGLLIPTISANILEYFLNNLKEYQADLTKKICEHLEYNQDILNKIQGGVPQKKSGEESASFPIKSKKERKFSVIAEKYDNKNNLDQEIGELSIQNENLEDPPIIKLQPEVHFCGEDKIKYLEAQNKELLEITKKILKKLNEKEMNPQKLQVKSQEDIFPQKLQGKSQEDISSQQIQVKSQAYTFKVNETQSDFEVLNL